MQQPPQPLGSSIFVALLSVGRGPRALHVAVFDLCRMPVVDYLLREWPSFASD